MSLRLHATTVSDIGLVRSNNEDSAHAGVRVVALADGIGGMPAGELASDIVVRALAALDQTRRPGEPLAALRDTVEEANQRIHEVSEADEAKDGMGTTVTALMLAGEEIALINVGDSRCYLERDGELSRLTKDDTFVQTLVDQGSADPGRGPGPSAPLHRHPGAAGLEYEPSCAVLRPARPGDRYLLCSDGLSDMVTDDAIGLALRTYPDLDECAQSLIRARPRRRRLGQRHRRGGRRRARRQLIEPCPRSPSTPLRPRRRTNRSALSWPAVSGIGHWPPARGCPRCEPWRPNSASP